MTKPSDGFSRSLQLVAVGCALVITVTVARKEFILAALPRKSTQSERIPVKDWEKFLKAGHRLGPETAKHVVLEFADFECPGCREFSTKTLRALRERHPEDVAVVFRHWPLPYHRLAVPAAIASECAAEQGRFPAFHDALFEHQDSIGLKLFLDFARDAGIPDLASFERCSASPRIRARVEQDAEAAKAFGGDGTPTIGVNGTRFSGVPSLAAIEAALR